MAKNKNMRLLKVTWADAFGTQGWRPLPEGPVKAPECNSVGYELQNDKEGILLAQTLTWSLNDGDVTGHIFIPRGMVKKVRRIKDV